MAWRPSVTTLLQTTNQQVIPTPPERREQLHYWHTNTERSLIVLHWGENPDYLPLRWGRPPDAPQGQSIYWELQSLDRSKTSISKRSSERPESKIIRSFFFNEPRYSVRRLCPNEWFFHFHLPAGYKRQCWQPISFWPAGLFLIWLSGSQEKQNKHEFY